jgi:hypothetical protein
VLLRSVREESKEVTAGYVLPSHRLATAETELRVTSGRHQSPFTLVRRILKEVEGQIESTGDNRGRKFDLSND